MKRNSKKKGFTLIELIAVIAILAILGAVLVPRITGYKVKAQKSNYQSSAKVIVNAIEAYNADAETEIDETAALSTVISQINKNGTIIDTTDSSYDDLKELKIEKLRKVAKGDFSISEAGTVTAD